MTQRSRSQGGGSRQPAPSLIPKDPDQVDGIPRWIWDLDERCGLHAAVGRNFQHPEHMFEIQGMVEAEIEKRLGPVDRSRYAELRMEVLGMLERCRHARTRTQAWKEADSPLVEDRGIVNPQTRI